MENQNVITYHINHKLSKQARLRNDLFIVVGSIVILISNFIHKGQKKPIGSLKKKRRIREKKFSFQRCCSPNLHNRILNRLTYFNK